MRVITPTSFAPAAAWDALPIARFDQPATVRLHWTDQPYRWHVNDGPEVFVVLTGRVQMRHRDAAGAEQITDLAPGDIFYAAPGDAHVAHPQGAAHVLVVEQEGSV